MNREISKDNIIEKLKLKHNTYNGYSGIVKLKFFGVESDFEILFRTFEVNEINEEQVTQYLAFIEKSEVILEEVEDAILEYYLDCYEEMDLQYLLIHLMQATVWELD